MTSLIQASSLAKSFSGVRALKGVDFELKAGEVHALIGENGAGKSTLIKIITGAHQPDSGSLAIAGHTVSQFNPSAARALGVAVIYQQPALFPELSVAENIALGLEEGSIWRRIDWRKRHKRAAELLKRIGAEISPDALAKSLSMPQQQLVEIARALGAEAKILILDEPTASLSQREAEKLLQLIRELRSRQVGLIYVSHRLDELFEIADRVTVLRDGESISTREMSDIDRPTMIRLMVGREVSAVFPKREVKIGDTLLELRNLNSQSAGIHSINLSLRSGEILGLAGLVGAGRTELAQTLFGIHPADSGEIILRGQSITIHSPAEAVKQGIAYVPEDRRRHGVIQQMSLTTNTSLAVISRISNHGFLHREAELTLTTDFIDKLEIHTASPFAPAGTLSGGNQQKVALSRWLATEPSIIILDEPTQGVDVGAKSEIHKLMGDLAERGFGILLISSEMSEILGMSDRIAVMQAGKITCTLDRTEATQEKILTAALVSVNNKP
jgi:rhamnose transport system ATP-binding protein